MTNAEVRFSKSLHSRKPEGSLGRTAQDVHLDSHTAPELCIIINSVLFNLLYVSSLKQNEAKSARAETTPKGVNQRSKPKTSRERETHAR